MKDLEFAELAGEVRRLHRDILTTSREVDHIEQSLGTSRSKLDRLETELDELLDKLVNTNTGEK